MPNNFSSILLERVGTGVACYGWVLEEGSAGAENNCFPRPVVLSLIYLLCEVRKPLQLQVM